MPATAARVRFPEADNGVLKPVKEFKIGDRWVSLYTNPGYTESCPFTMYWNDTGENVQHNMNYLEVFAALAGLLNGNE